MTSPKPLNIQDSAVNPDGLRSVQPNEFLPPVGRWATLGGIAMLTIFGATIALAAVLKYPATIKAPITIRPTGELRIVQAAATGKVTRMDVKAYQVVQQGQAIAHLDDTRLQTQKRQLQSNVQQTQRQLDQLTAQIQALESQIAAEAQAAQRVIAAAKADVRLNQRQHQERQVTTQAEVREAEAAVKLSREELARYQALANTGAVSQSQISEKGAALEASLARLQRAQATLNPSTASVEMSSERVFQERARGTSTLANLNRERQALIQQKAKLEQEFARDRQELRQVETDLITTVIRAPITGTIQQLNLRNLEQLVRPGDVVAQIAPSNVPLLIQAWVTPQDISQVTIGQPVKIKVSGCPYPDYGVLAGTVTSISPDAIAPASQTEPSLVQNTTRPTSDARYQVTVQPQTHFLKSHLQPCTLQAGMDGSADIVIQKETVLTFFLKKARLLTGI